MYLTRTFRSAFPRGLILCIAAVAFARAIVLSAQSCSHEAHGRSSPPFRREYAVARSSTSCKCHPRYWFQAFRRGTFRSEDAVARSLEI